MMRAIRVFHTLYFAFTYFFIIVRLLWKPDFTNGCKDRKRYFVVKLNQVGNNKNLTMLSKINPIEFTIQKNLIP